MSETDKGNEAVVSLFILGMWSLSSHASEIRISRRRPGTDLAGYAVSPWTMSITQELSERGFALRFDQEHERFTSIPFL